MREILFRGKWLGNGEWVEGYYCKISETTYAFAEDYERNERRMNLFDKVKCNGFYSKVRDGTYICLDSQNLKAAHMNSNAVDTECLVEEDVDRVEKTYYKHVKQNFCGVIVGFTDLIVTGYLDVIYNDAIDVGVGILPEQFFVQKNPNHVEKCAIVYYANNKKHYVPLEDIECENSDERNNNHD